VNAPRRIDVASDAFTSQASDDDLAGPPAHEPEGAQEVPGASHENAWDQWKSIRDLF
jgi:hypothetical protein